MHTRISLCLIAKNEEANLPACLPSVADLVDEIIVVDTGSTDRTKEVAAALGARVFDFPWCDSFAAARNESLRHATGEWIFWLDGDERLDDTNRSKFRALRAGLNGDAAAFVMKQRSVPDGASGSATEVDQVRLFRNHPAVRWSYRVHEQILPAVRRAGHDVRFTDIAIEHTGYQDSALQRRKTERNLRLLRLEYTEQPDDPFTLFNLGWALQELGQLDQALPLLRRSLERCGPGDSIVRKLYVLLSHAHRRLGQPREALAVCRAGRARCPDDPELLFVEGVLLLEVSDPAGAEVCLRQLLALKPGAHFASLDASLRGGKARHHLALSCRGQGRLVEAEEQWQVALTEQPDFGPALVGLGELYLTQNRWAELDQVLARLPADPEWEVEGLLLRGRACMAQRMFAGARQLLETAVARSPRAVGPRVLLTHALLQDGTDPKAAEQALRDVLALDPRQAECWRNLAVLLHQQRRLAEAVTVCRSGRAACPDNGPLLLQHGLYLAETDAVQEAEACLLQYLTTQPGAAGAAARAQRCSARHQLALLNLRKGRPGEAEAYWRAVRAEEPDHLGARLGLAEVCLVQQRDAELDDLLAELGDRQEGELEVPVLRARRHLARRQFTEARRLLDDTIAQHPNAVWPWVILSHVLLQEGRDLAAAERVLRRILELDPQQAEARRNLTLLLSRRESSTSVDRDTATPPMPATTGLESRLQPANAGTPTQPSTGAEPLDGRRLRLAFACFTQLPHHLDTPQRMPLGGSESALCYLIQAQARRGHDVTLFHPSFEPALSGGVHCLPMPPLGRHLEGLDALILLNLGGNGRDFRHLLTPPTRLVLWTGHALDQPAVMPLRHAAERDAYDAFVFVSDWQRRQFIHQFGLHPDKTTVLRNGISPAFENLFSEGEPVLAAKSRPPVLAYTSTPYRGLDLLLDAFPRIRQAVPGTTLKVFSSMGVYQVPPGEDQSRFGWLYERCRETEGVEYVGSRPQPELAAELRKAAVLAYPNSYPETSCIAVLEAMAAGCRVVTSRRAALPETTAGFARLVPPDDDRPAFVDHFVEETVQALADLDGPEAEDKVCRQIAHVHQHHSWAALADIWVQWLNEMRH